MSHHLARFLPAALVVATLLSACSDSGQPGGDVMDPPPTGDFEITRGAIGTLVEGSDETLYIPLGLTRGNGHTLPVTFTLQGGSTMDTDELEASFPEETLVPGADDGGVLLKLRIAPLPILPHSRRLVLTASDGTDSDQLLIDVPVEPVDAPDVYLLAGQSNMVGFSGDGTRQAYEGGPDASDPRILQLNVTSNPSFGNATRTADYVARDRNVLDPAIIVAEDPLHVPAGDDDGGEEGQYIGLGLSFAKAALASTTRQVVLVPAALSGSAFCDNNGGPPGQWNAGPVEDPALGNTFLFERAVARTNFALAETGGILRGILWHQGESDANERCAPSYGANLERLARELRLRIDADLRGAGARRSDANVPFVLGTLSRGADEREDLSNFGPAKSTVDDAIRALPERLEYSSLANLDQLIPANGYPCGNTSCIHFGAAALREMGRTYEAELRRAAASALP